ncbi:MAG: hypothetical protein ABI895_16545 [Deltaproteobacteria bacterium]
MKASIWLWVLLFWSSASQAADAGSGQELRGTLYRLGSHRQQRLYTWSMQVCADVWTSHYYRLDGRRAVEDRTRFSGNRLAEYSYVRHTIGESSSVRVKGERLDFTYQRGGNRQVETRTTVDVFLTGPSVFQFIQQHLPELLADKEFEFKYGVLDRLDYYTFALRAERGAGSEPRIRVRATSPFVRMAIDPIYVTLSNEGKFRSITGRTIVMEQSGKQLLPIDAEMVVEFEAPGHCRSQATSSAAAPSSAVPSSAAAAPKQDD